MKSDLKQENKVKAKRDDKKTTSFLKLYLSSKSIMELAIGKFYM
jgi:hypothetical protein